MSPRQRRLTGNQVVQALKRAGWYVDHQRGSHIYLRHSNFPKSRVTVPAHSGEIIKPKTLQSILRQANLSAEEFQEFL